MLHNWRRVAKQRDAVHCTWVFIVRSWWMKTPRSWTVADGETKVEPIKGPEVGSRWWLRAVVSHMNSVLSEFSWSRLVDIQSATDFRRAVTLCTRGHMQRKSEYHRHKGVATDSAAGWVTMKHTVDVCPLRIIPQAGRLCAHHSLETTAWHEWNVQILLHQFTSSGKVGTVNLWQQCG